MQPIAIAYPAETVIYATPTDSPCRAYWRARAGEAAQFHQIDATAPAAHRRLLHELEAEFVARFGHDVALDHAAGLTNAQIRRAAIRAGAAIRDGAAARHRAE